MHVEEVQIFDISQAGTKTKSSALMLFYQELLIKFHLIVYLLEWFLNLDNKIITLIPALCIMGNMLYIYLFSNFVMLLGQKLICI